MANAGAPGYPYRRPSLHGPPHGEGIRGADVRPRHPRDRTL